jgi:hypothetical protein
MRWLVFVLSVIALLTPALWNGFPLVFADTGGYLARPFEGTLDIGRSAFYGAFLAAGIPFDFWPNVIVQAALTAWLLMLLLRVDGAGARPALTLLLVIALVMLTSLPWYVGQLMPDIFLPLTVLALYLLGFRFDALHRAEAMALLSLIVVAIAYHMAILAIAIGLMLTFMLVRLLAGRLRLPPPRLGWPAVATAGGILLALLTNLAIAGTLAFTPGGTSFAFGRLVQDGIIARYLDERCPDPRLRLCAFRGDLPTVADGWLWGHDSPLHQLGGWAAFEPQARRIILDTLRLYPGAHLATALKAATEQLFRLKTGEGMYSRDNWHAEETFERFAPEVVPRFMASRQQRDLLDFTAINMVQVPLALLSLAALPLIILLGSRQSLPGPAAALALIVLVALVGNAALSGILSNPNDRYQSRVAWLAPLAVAIALLSRRRVATVLQSSQIGSARAQP